MLQQQGNSMSESKPSQRFHSLKAEQVEVLHQVLSGVVPIHGRGNFPTLELRPRDIIIAVRARLQQQGIIVRDVRLNGSTASHVLVQDNGTSYKDLDIIFGVELPSQEEFQVIKESVLGCLLDCLPAGVNRERISSATMKEAYVQKMVKVFNEHDRWSLISLSNNSGKNLELKFVSTLRRQFEFSVDSFQIILDRLLESYIQQESQHKKNAMDVKDQPADQSRKDSPSTSTGEKENSAGRDSSSLEKGTQISQTEQREKVHEKESQTEFSNQIKDSTMEKVKEEKMVTEFEESREKFPKMDTFEQTPFNLESEQKKITQEAETQSEHGTEVSVEEECSEHTQSSDGHPPAHSNHPNLLVEQKEHTEQTGQSESLKTSIQSQPLKLAKGSHNNSDETDVYESVSEDQRENEKDATQHFSAPYASASLHAETRMQLAEMKAELREQIQADSKCDTETNQITEESLAPEAKQMDHAKDIDCFCSISSITLHTQDTHNTLHTDESEKSLEAVNPADTQDILPAPPSLVSDKKTSPPSCKASERLSYMVVLKHSSPKPPRRMCRKVTPNSYSNPVFERDACPSSNPEPDMTLRVISLDLAEIPTTPVSAETNPAPEPSLPTNLDSKLDFTSAPDTPDIMSTSTVDPALPQEPSSSLLITEYSSGSLKGMPHGDEQSPSSLGETATLQELSEPLNSLATGVSHTDGTSSDIQKPAHTSVVGPGDEDNNSHTKMMDPPVSSPLETSLSSPSSSHISSPPVSSLTPPVFSLSPPCSTPSPPNLSLSPPCSTPSPPNLSPPLCLTPPSHCFPSPMQNTEGSSTSFNSPPLSFSPTSSCLSSPTYLTPPLLSLSPTPLCPTPPPPCLSPPLLCLTPPVESEDLIPQVSSDIQPLILNTDGEEQIKEPSTQQGVPGFQLEDEKEQNYISLLHQVAEPVSFPITIPNSSSHVLSHTQSGAPVESDPPIADEASSSMPENKEAHKVIEDLPEQSNTPDTNSSVPAVEVLAESMYGDFEAAMDHLRYRLIATRNPEEIRGGGLLKYSNLLVRDYRPASETQIKTLERYMCSRFFIDFPDVQEQQRKILSYLKNHFIGEERSKYQYLMTLRRVVDDSTVCLMGHERRQTLNMITVLALKVLGEQNIIPNTDHVTCFYQPAPYLTEHSTPYITEPSYCSYYIPQGGSTLLYQPYPLHLHTQTGLV